MPHDTSLDFQPDTSALGGKVLKASLAVLTPPVASDEPRLKRLLLKQGELAQCYDGDWGIRYIAFMAFIAGACRGNHYHKKKDEWVYLTQGEVLLHVEDIESKRRETLCLRTGDLVFIAPAIAHALCPAQSGHALEYSPQKFDRTDVFAYPLV